MSDFTPLGALIDEARQAVTVTEDFDHGPQVSPPSFCVVCDAAEGECNHEGARYHESYMSHPDYKPGSGSVPNELKDWFYRNDHGYDQEGQRSEPEARPLDAIRRELVPWIFLNERLSARLEEFYAINPHQVSLLSSELRRSLEAGRIENPSGTLYNELGKIRAA